MKVADRRPTRFQNQNIPDANMIRWHCLIWESKPRLVDMKASALIIQPLNRQYTPNDCTWKNQWKNLRILKFCHFIIIIIQECTFFSCLLTRPLSLIDCQLQYPSHYSVSFLSHIQLLPIKIVKALLLMDPRSSRFNLYIWQRLF